MFNSLLGLTVPFFMYGVFKVMIKEEEEYLEDKFGEAYFEYKRKVGSIFPKIITFFRKEDK
jgi:protein-S-isoprenylcysteine O-methyltransferase Ste14